MKLYNEVTKKLKEFQGYRCDGCGREGTGPWFVEVAIEVNYQEEYGSRDEYDYCDECLMERADKLIAAGSRAPILTGEDESA